MNNKITHLRTKLGLKEESIYSFNEEIYKIDPTYYEDNESKGKLILVTAITPTVYGEGKTTMSIALADSLNKLGHNALLSLREPSMGPVFGTKGGAVGGGKCKVLPSEEINLNFTGDFNRVTTINNLISSVLDNEQYYNSSLNVDSSKILFHRCMDICDRFLKELTFTVRRKKSADIVYNSSFVITAASEVMAIFTLAQDKEDFIKRLNEVTVALSKDGKVIKVKDLNISNGLMTLSNEMLKPNLVQTLYGTPCFIHAGPFANVATGTSSAISLKLSLKLSDIVITECGFGADLGYEKYVNIVSRNNNIAPDLVLFVVTTKALKYHGNGDLNEGFANLDKHIENIRNTGYNPVIAINQFDDDLAEELDLVAKHLKEKNVDFGLVTSYATGEEGAIELAKVVLMRLKEDKPSIKRTYELDQKVEDKIEAISKKFYGCSSIEYSEKAKEDLQIIYKYNFDKFAVCMAKTPNSFSDDPKLVGRADNTTLHISKIEVNSGSGLIIPYTGEMILMPGYSKKPLIKDK